MVTHTDDRYIPAAIEVALDFMDRLRKVEVEQYKGAWRISWQAYDEDGEPYTEQFSGHPAERLQSVIERWYLRDDTALTRSA